MQDRTYKIGIKSENLPINYLKMVKGINFIKKYEISCSDKLSLILVMVIYANKDRKKMTFNV